MNNGFHKINIDNKPLDFDRVLQLVDRAISPDFLNSTQEKVLREVWNGKTYAKIADEHNYDTEYIKTVGCNLWQTLSTAFDEQINKGNFIPLMRRKVSYISLEANNDEFKSDLSESAFHKAKKLEKYHWHTAPEIQNFVGREAEIEVFKFWKEIDCNCIVVSGMIGCGKTSLVTKFAKSFYPQFDYVIWYSLDSPPPITALLNDYLNLIGHDYQNLTDFQSTDLSLLINQFLKFFEKNKVLIIFDGLENILEINKAKESVCYQKEFEGYGQFMRSIVSTNHQSLLICTTRIKPKALEYYSNSKIKFLEIKGLRKKNIDEIVESISNNSTNKSRLKQISSSFQNNPLFLNLINKKLDTCDLSEASLLVQELSTLDEIITLLEQEIDLLLESEKEIIYWLSMFNSSVSLKELLTCLEFDKPKLKLMQSLNYLQKRNLITQENAKFYLMPVMKNFLRKKLVQQSLSGNREGVI